MTNRPGPVVLQVHIFRDGEFMGTDIFAERQIVIGRDPDEADLVLESSQVSRKHAIIENDNGKVRVRDAGSTNGVFLNADKVTEPVEVTRLDEIRIGEFSLKLKFAKGKSDRDDEPAPRPQDATGRMVALDKSGRPKHVEPARSDPAPMVGGDQTRLIQPGGEVIAAQRSANASRPVLVARTASAPDLSEFDDVLDDPPEDSKRSPRAEFRRRDEPVDRDKLGDMLAGIGISEPGEGVDAATRIDAKPLPMAHEGSSSGSGKRKVSRAKRAGYAELATGLEGAGASEQATQTNITGYDADDTEDDSSRVNGEMNGRSNGREAFARGGGRTGFVGASGPAPVPREEPEAESLISGAPVQARGMPKPPDVLGLDGDPMQPFEPHADVTNDDDDDDEGDEDFVPNFSLAQHILGEELPPKHGVACVEVLVIRDEIVESVTLLAPGESFWVGPPPSIAKLMDRASAKEGGVPYRASPHFELVKHKRPGEVEVEFKKDARGWLTRGGRALELGAVQTKQGKKQARRGTTMMGLVRGEIAQVTDGALTYHVRHIIAPAPLRDSRPFIQRFKPERLLMTAAVGALGAHLLMGLLFTIFAGHHEPKEQLTEEFVEVTVEPEMKLEEPPPPPPPEPTPPAPEPPPEQKPVPQKVPKNQKLPKVAVTQAPPNPAPVGVLGLLNKTGATQAPSPAAAVAAISNLSAVKTPSGSSGYKVSGLIGKLPTSELSIGGGGGGPMTKGGAALLRGGAGVLTGKATGKVGGLVTKLPQQMRSTGGSLDRDEIQKVVNKHIGEIQRCYERELLKTPNLAGKVTVEWVVATSGTVKSSRQKDATLQSSAAINCMLSSIKGWQFPQPRGGEVVVSYPFNFSAIGM